MNIGIAILCVFMEFIEPYKSQTQIKLEVRSCSPLYVFRTHPIGCIACDRVELHVAW